MFSLRRVLKDTYMLPAFLAACLLLFSLGCDSNNPSGPENSNTTATLALASASTELSAIELTLSDAYTKSALDPRADIAIDLYKGGSKLSGTTTLIAGSKYTYSGLDAAIYTIYIRDGNNYYRSYQTLVQLQPKTTYELAIKLIPTSADQTGVSSLNFVGKVLDGTTKSPILFATVKIGPKDNIDAGFTAITLADGNFFLEGISSGSYDISFSKDGYASETYSLEVGTQKDPTKITFKGQQINTTALYQDGGGNVHTGYDLGEINLGYEFTNTGALAGYLTENGTPLANTSFKLFYKKTAASNDIIWPILTFKTNDKGYFKITSLPAGFYGIGDTNTTPQPISDGAGNLTWTLAGGKVYAGVLFQVIPPYTTDLPSQ